MRKYILIGTGNRMIEMFLKPIITDYQSYAQIIAIFDINITRAKYVLSLIPYTVKIYSDLNLLFDENDADYCIIATVDCMHEEYINEALKRNIKVICEKPVCTTLEQCIALFNLTPSQQKNIVITFNSRYMPINIKIDNIIKSGILGKIYSIKYHYYVDINHGAEYFRRWHRYKKNSGSLLVHKSVHHFDLINWWISDRVKVVNASGQLLRFGENKKQHGIVCRKCKEKCRFKISKDKMAEFKEMYFDAEKTDGYLRDKCVFDNDIDIYDTMHVSLLYQSGIFVDYSLMLYSAYTGFSLKIYGEKYQLELEYNQNKNENIITILDYDNNIINSIAIDSIPLKKHNGGDEKLREILFTGTDRDKLPHLEEGVNAVLTGIAACKSIETGCVIVTQNLIKEENSNA